MWLGPALFTAISIFLWQYVGSVFMPALIARRVIAFIPALGDIENVILINAAVLYFGAYFVFAVFWKTLKTYFRHPFLAGLALWLVNLLVIYPLLGRGVLGYKLPQGWIAATFPLLVAHWLFARGLQFQIRRFPENSAGSTRDAGRAAIDHLRK